jgi:hypothetical protein
MLHQHGDTLGVDESSRASLFEEDGKIFFDKKSWLH